MTTFTICPDRVLTPDGFLDGAAVEVEDGLITQILTARQGTSHGERIEIEGDLIPGFIDLQVNGGGGVLFNDSPTVDAIAAIAATHRRFGTTGFLPTLISDSRDAMAQAIAAVDAAIEAGIPGVLGIHLEGPFLNPDKRGIHDKSKIGQIDQDALDLITSSKHGKTLVTLAPECVSPDEIAHLTQRGVIVAAGHTAASYEAAMEAVACGLSGFTHLFNAMPPLASREPGPIGAAFDSADTWSGMIVDGIHVHPATLRAAAKVLGPERLILVTDAMPSVGDDQHGFKLGELEIRQVDGKCVSPDGTLAGAHLNMNQAVRNASSMLRLPLETCVRMASANPARAIGLGDEVGRIVAGMRANLVLLGQQGEVIATWIDGQSSVS